MAHSMGGIVLGEALKQAGSTKIVDTAIMSQAAVSAHYADSTFEQSIYNNSEGGSDYATARAVRTSDDVHHYRGFFTTGGDLEAIGGSQPRFRNIDDAAHRLVNYFNPTDFALTLWGVNQATKPTLSISFDLGLLGFLALDGVPTPVAQNAEQLWSVFSRNVHRGFAGWGYNWASGGGFIKKQRFDGTSTPLNPGASIQRLYEAMAFGASSVALPIGRAELPQNSIFGAGLNLTSQLLFGSRFNDSAPGHSAQFVHSAIDVAKYWQAIKQEAQS